MNIPRYSIRRPVTILVLYVMAMGVAATLVPKIGVDLFPAMSRPMLSVYTSFPGSGPADVERNITIPLENALAASRGLVEMTSNSSFESSSINLNFAYGTDMDKAVADAQSLVNRAAASLPEGAGAPLARRFDMSAMPIMRLALRGNHPPDQLRIFAEEEIQANIERIEGVASATVTGGNSLIVEAAVSQNRLAAFNLTLGDVSQALKGQNILSSGGSLLRGDRNYQLLARQELASLDQIRRVVVKNTGNGPAGGVLLEDVASVRLAYNDSSARVYVNGENGVYIRIQKESDSNSVQTARRVREMMDDMNPSLPGGISLSVLSDDTALISATLAQVYNNAWQGALLAMAILFIFLRSVKGTLIIGIAIPVSILLTLMFMAVFGFSLNLLSMTGLILGLGMTVDGSIVILENIHNYRLRGAKPEIAAILGSQEMTRAITASTTTTLCVFIPLIIYKNDLQMMGQMFSDLIFTVVISLSCSLAVALTIVPALCGPILRLNTRKQKPLKTKWLRRIDDSLEGFFIRMENGYRNALEYCLDHRLPIIVLVLLMLAFSLLQFDGIGMNLFIRNRTDDSVTLNVSLPQGAPLDATESALMDLAGLVRANVGNYRNIILTAQRSGNAQGTLQVILPPPAEQTDTPAGIIRKLTPLIRDFPGLRVSFRAGRSMGTTAAVEIALGSRDVSALNETAEEILGILRRHIPEIEDPSVNINEGSPQLQIEIDRERAAALGISVGAIAQEIRIAMDGAAAASFSRGDRLVAIQVRLREEDRRGLPNLDSLFVVSRSGSRVSLSNVARIVENRSPVSIRRENRERVLRITGNLPGSIAATDMQRRLERTVKENLVPREGVTVRYLGEAAEVRAYNWRFAFIIGMAVFLVFGLMASQFESFVDPLVIFFTIPLLFIGVIWIYKIGSEAMSVFSAVGIVALVGVVVNNGIVLVDYTNTLRARGYPLREACVEGGRSRLRPILMTSLTTILGMVPIAFFPGPGADTIQPIGKTFVGGLTVSTVMTLFVIPVMYSVLNGRRKDRAELTRGGAAAGGAG